MYYDDESRNLNLLAGLLCGTLLGAGIALAAAPARRRPLARTVRRGVRRGGRAAAVRWGGVRDGMTDWVEDASASVRRRLGG